MPEYNVRVRRVTEEVLDFTIVADSDVHVHQMMELQAEVENRPVASREVRTSVVTCHRILDTHTKGG